LTMRSKIEAGRALTYEAAVALTQAHEGDQQAQVKVDVLTPIVKAWCTNMACEVTSLGIQIHGGMGFIEETGAAQYYRDARILPIYEGTNGIQAADLAFRKILRDKGVAANAYIRLIESRIASSDKALFAESLKALKATTEFIIKNGAGDLTAAAAVPYLEGFGIVAGAALLSASAEKAGSLSDKKFAEQKTKSKEFFIGNVLPFAQAHLKIATEGSKSL
jgi:3-(methylthio)propanoyl-CoA dehydrogenase